MAKRDKLYTVNKWNKPFFEEERKRRLYPDGGFKPFVHENLGWKVFGYNDTSYNPIYNLSSLTKQNQADPKSTSWNDYSGNDYTDTLTPIQRLLTTSAFSPQDTPAPKAGVDDSNKSKTSDILSTINNALNGIKSTGLLGDGILSGTKPATTGITKDFEIVGNKATGILNSKTYTFPVSSFTGDIPTLAGSAEPLTEAAAKHASDMIAKDMASASASTASKGTNFFRSGIGQAALLTGMLIAGGLGRNAISGELQNTLPGQIGSGIRSIGYTAAPFAGPWAPLVAGIAETIALGLDLFGSIKHDNGTSGYIDALRASNPQGSDEFLANLQANTGLSKSRATYKDGIFTDSGENWAKKRNADVAQAYNDWQQRIKYALANNRRKQMMHAIYENSKAMGGKLNKCNKKSYGGYLDSATPTGFNFLSDLTNIQMQKNQNNQDMNTTTGNSFMGISDGSSMFANGGPINIKKSHRGRLTELKKRTGKTEAELYNDGNPAHKKMVVFALNSRRWHKHALGGYLKGKVYDIPEEEVQRLIKAGYEVEYL